MRSGSIEAHLLEETLLEENMKLEVEKCTAHCYNNRTRHQQILEKFYLVIPKT